MSVDLSGIGIRSARIRVLDFGAVLTPALGGPTQRINRLGNRFAVDIELPPMPEDGEGRRLAAKLQLALSEGALFAFPDPNKTVEGTPTVDGAVAGGTSLPIKGLTPNLVIRQGKFLSIIHDGRRYLHCNSAEAIADEAGTVTLAIMPMLRAQLADNDVVELARPKIEGWVSAPEWDLMLEPFLSTSFTISEAA